MFEVHCPSCRASYQVDERRVPSTGLKMRCPKCGESFQVAAPASAPVLGAALGLGGSPPAPNKSTTLGVAAPAGPPRPGPPRPAGLKQTMLGVAPAAPVRSELELDSIEEVDLDESSDLEMDLPVPSAGAPGVMDLPAPREDWGLPAPAPARARELELPGGPDSSDLPDIPGVLPETRRPPSVAPDEFELPAPRAFDDLPDLGAVLPSPKPGAVAPSSKAGFPRAFEDLPDLGAELPDLGASLPDLGAGLPDLGGELPVHSSAPNSINLPSASSQLPAVSEQLPDTFGRPRGAPRSTEPATFGEVDFGGGESADDIFGGRPERPETLAPDAPKGPSAFGEVNFGGADDDAEFDAFPTEKSEGGGAPAARGTGYGEVALDGGSSDLSLGADVERDPVPAGPPAAATAQVVSSAVSEVSTPQVIVRKRGVSVGTKVAIGLGLSLAVGGGVLTFLPDVGPYGVYAIVDRLRADDYARALAADVAGAEKRLALDTAKEVEAAFREVSRGQEDAPRSRERRAFRAFLGLFRHARFGADSPIVAEGKVLLQQLREEGRSDVDFYALAELAELLTVGKADEALRRAGPHVSKGPLYAMIVGEAALREKNFEVAEKAFAATLARGPTASGKFGLARLAAIRGSVEEATKLADETLALSPAHTQAELLKLSVVLDDRAKDDALVKRLGEISVLPGATANERARAFTLLGRLHLSRSRLKQAEAAFGDALKLEAGDVDAQIGLADSLFEAGRFAESLARYEAALKADPTSLDAELGVVRAKLRLEALEDASKILTRLLAEHPTSARVQFWLGRAKDAIGDRDAARKAYETAIAGTENYPELVQAYVALTRLHGQAGAYEAADIVIRRAEERFPNSPDVYRALAEVASGRGLYDEAIRQLDRALALDDKNIGLRFLRGIALRQARKFEDAMAEFDEVEKIEKDYPGLSLERGNLYEAAGHTEEALKSYEAALAAAPNDVDLKLRVGCGKANAGKTEAAMELLRVVFEERAQSAEVNYCMGLALLREGKDLPEARRFFERAVGLDMTRATYHLYVGWVAIELRDYGLAAKELDKALELDRTAADAYWQRGLLRVRQGAVKDAETDLRKALELAPSRFEAHAALAEAYLQAGREQDSLTEWKLAIDGGGSEPFWHYQYGKLLVDNRAFPEAKPQLQQAIEKAEKRAIPPPWLWDAHRLLAMALGRTKEALPHWQTFAEKQPASPYAREALREMKAILALP